MRSIVVALVSGFVWFSAAADPAIYHPSGAHPSVRQAALELQQFIFRATGDAWPVEVQDQLGSEGEGFLIAIADSLPTGVPDFPFGHDTPQHDGFIIHRHGSDLFVISAESPFGVMNGAVHVGEAFGLAFYPDLITRGGSEVSWADVSDELAAGSYSPEFRVRAAAPKMDAIVGPSRWDAEDWHSYIDSVIRMRMNTLVLDLSDLVPQSQTNEYAPRTPIRPEAESVGAAAPYLIPDDPLADSAISTPAARDALANAIHYAYGRGVNTVAIIDVTGNPLDPATQEAYADRLDWYYNEYPSVDILAIRLADPGAVLTRDHDPLGHYAGYWFGAHDAGANAAARLALYVMLTQRIAAAANPHLAITFIDDTANFDAQTVKKLLGALELNAGDTFAADGSPLAAAGAVNTISGHRGSSYWMHAPSLPDVAREIAAVASANSAGFAFAHYRLRETAIAFSYCAARAWDKTVDQTSYLHRIAERRFSSEDPDDLAELLSALETIRPFGSEESGDVDYPAQSLTFDAAQFSDLARILSGLEKKIEELPSGHAANRPTINLSSAIIPFIERGGAVVRDPSSDIYGRLVAAVLIAQSIGLNRSAATDDPQDAESDPTIGPAIHLLAHGMNSKTDLSIIADIAARLSPADAATDTPESLRDERPVWVLPDRAIAITQGDPADVDAVLRWRMIGESRWHDVPLAYVGAYTYAMAFPNDARGMAIEYGVEARRGLRAVAAWPTGFPSATETAVIHGDVPKRTVAEAPPGRTTIRMTSKSISDGGIKIEWDVQPTELYDLQRNGERLVRTPAPIYVDYPAGGDLRYELTAISLSENASRSQAIKLSIDTSPDPQAPETLNVETRDGRVVLSWFANDPNTDRYYVTDGIEDDPIVTLPADTGYTMRTSIPAEAGEAASFRVRAVSADGRTSENAPMAGIVVSDTPTRPAYQVMLRNEATLFAEIAELTDAGIFLGGPGLREGPHPTPIAGDTQLTIELWFNLESLRGRPLLVTSGLWPAPQATLRLRRGILELALEDGTLIRGGKPKRDAWHHACFVIAGDMARIYLDGQQTGRARRGEESASVRIPDIKLPAAALITRGVIDGVSVYDTALTPEEIADRYAVGPPASGQ